MKKIMSLTLALSMVGNVAFANGPGSEVVEPIRQAEEDLSDLESRLNETVDMFSAMEDKLIEIEVEKLQLDLIEQKAAIRELNKKIKDLLILRDTLVYSGVIYGVISAGLYSIVLAKIKQTKGADPKAVEWARKKLNSDTHIPIGFFAVLALSGAANEYLIFETREELAEFQQLIEETELKLEKEIEALNQN